VRSFVRGDELVATWQPAKMHEAFPGCLNGGITGALLDCHSNWAASYHFMQSQGLDAPPCTVTADYAVKLRRPIPTDGPVSLTARVIEGEGKRAVVEAELVAGGKVCATCLGTFVQVGEGHPAYHRW